MYSVLAGFRTGRIAGRDGSKSGEEVGIESKTFVILPATLAAPNSLMIGFTATYASGDIAVETQELVDAAWFSKHDRRRF